MVQNKRRVLMLLFVMLSISMLLCACVKYQTPDDQVLVDLKEEASGDLVIDDDGVVAENEYLRILNVQNITPRKLAVFGVLTEQAKEEGVTAVRIDGAREEGIPQLCNEEYDYFMIPIDLTEDRKATFNAYALKADAENEESDYAVVGEALTFTAPYNSTAEDRVDGKSVTMGNDSRMYFTKYLDDYLSKELYTASGLRAVKSQVNNNKKALVDLAKGNEVEMIYVFLPNITSIDDSMIMDSDKATKNPNIATRYDQVVGAVQQTRVECVDMKSIIMDMIEKDGMNVYDFYRRTDSHPTELTSFLIYEQVMKKIAAIDEDTVVHSLEDYTVKEVNVRGGDYVRYRNLDPTIVRETIKLLEPNFAYNEEYKKIDFRLYNDKDGEDYSMFTTVDAEDAYTGCLERKLLKTGRTELPNVLIYRDENTAGASLMIAEGCDQALLVRAGSYSISMTDAATYRDKDEKKSSVDFIVVLVSEPSIGDAFKINK